MMVKNQTDHEIFAGGASVPPDGDFHQVKDDPGVRELIRDGALTKQERSSSAKSNDGDDS